MSDVAPPLEEALAAAPAVGPPGYWPHLDEVREGVGRYYDRRGTPISMRQWLRLRELPFADYSAVRQEQIGAYRVSTVWLGLDHSFGYGGPPILFETMVFGDQRRAEPTAHFPEGYDYHPDYEQVRYATEAEALAGHERIAEQVRLLVAAAPEGYEPVD